jgi:hypothetical protein
LFFNKGVDMKTYELLGVASANFVDIIGGTQSLERWVQDITTTEKIRNNPEVIILVIEKTERGYYGGLFITKEDFIRS